jgi:type III secretion protein C
MFGVVPASVQYRSFRDRGGGTRTGKAWAGCSIVLILLLAPGAFASPVPWKSAVYSHISNGEDLADLLRNFCSAHDLSAVLSEKVSGTVSGRFLRMPPEVFLKNICTAYGLLWYYDGGALYFFRSDERVSKVVTLNRLTFPGLRRALERAGVTDDRFPLRTLSDQGVVYVSGPPRYVEAVTEIARELDEKAVSDAKVRTAREVIRVFPLRHALADDLTLTFMDREMTVQGVATILRKIFQEPGWGISTAETRLKRVRRTVEKLGGKGLKSGEAPSPDNPPPEDRGEEAPPDGNAEGTGDTGKGTGASVTADTRLNAVVVRDTEDRMPVYEELVRLLDVPAGLVQIQATIMDISTDYLHELGVSWRFRKENDAGGIARDGKVIVESGLEAGEDLTPSAGALVAGSGFQFATVVGNATNYLLARVRALEEDGNARVLSRPSVLTLDNVDALLEHSQTFYVRVAGERDVDLFPVTYGIVLKVTPHVIREGDENRIKLVVNVEDGSVSTEEEVDNIPVVRKSSIHTQAIVREKESLLIGGYYHESEFRTVSGIPCLMRAPYLGRLFRADRTVSKRAERMFLITPRIVRHDAVPGGARPGRNGPGGGETGGNR